MEQLHNRDLLSYKIDKKIKYLCSQDEKESLKTLVMYLKTLLNEKTLLENQIEEIKGHIDKILLYNIYETE
jgi:hypothetical protein